MFTCLPVFLFSPRWRKVSIFGRFGVGPVVPKEIINWEDDMALVYALLAGLLYLIVSYLVDAFPMVTILNYEIKSEIIILPMTVVLIFLVGFIVRSRKSKNSQ